MPATRQPTGDQRGQATVAFLACTPLLVLFGLALLQLALVGYAAHSAAGAARAAARAELVGADPGRAARRALPGGPLAPARDPSVEVADGLVRVRLLVPRLQPLKPLLPPLPVGAEATLLAKEMER
jgi:hypothetical protein